MIYVVKPKARTRVFDPSNWALSAKAAVDSLQDAGVFEDDNAAVVTGVAPRTGARQKGANIRMSLVIIDQGRRTQVHEMLDEKTAFQRAATLFEEAGLRAELIPTYADALLALRDTEIATCLRAAGHAEAAALIQPDPDLIDAAWGED